VRRGGETPAKNHCRRKTIGSRLISPIPAARSSASLPRIAAWPALSFSSRAFLPPSRTAAASRTNPPDAAVPPSTSQRQGEDHESPRTAFANAGIPSQVRGGSRRRSQSTWSASPSRQGTGLHRLRVGTLSAKQPSARLYAEYKHWADSVLSDVATQARRIVAIPLRVAGRLPAERDLVLFVRREASPGQDPCTIHLARKIERDAAILLMAQLSQLLEGGSLRRQRARAAASLGDSLDVRGISHLRPHSCTFIGLYIKHSTWRVATEPKQ